MRRRIQSQRAGVALPMAILLIGFITAGIIGAFGRVMSESRTLDSNRTSSEAFALAERALEARVASGDTLPDSTRYTFADGYADVRVRRIRRAMGPQDTSVWLIQATATVHGGRRGRPPARRSVAQIAMRAAASMNANAAWSSLSGLRKNGGSGVISGIDECFLPDTVNVVAGAAVPADMFELKSNGGLYPFEGNPPVSAEGSQEEFANSVNVDWANIKSGAALPSHITVCPGGDGYIPSITGCSSWPDLSDPNYYPTILVNGSMTLGSGEVGQGLLIVTGRLTFTGGQETWRGLILVGQELIDNGTGWISGAVISGLDVKLGKDVAESEITEEAVANGTKTYRYNSCEVANALNGAATMDLIPNAWMDNWSTW